MYGYDVVFCSFVIPSVQEAVTVSFVDRSQVTLQIQVLEAKLMDVW